MNIFYKLNSMRLLIILSVLILSSCGMQGDLYLPDDGSEENTGMPQQTGKQ